MAKQPYIPLYIGDWEQDTNCITPIAEFALLKLTFKLFRAENKGVFTTNLRSLSVLFKSNSQETKEILGELTENNILEIEIISDAEISIKSRRMMREANISEARSEVGKTGGRGHKSKTKANVKQTESKSKAKLKQNTDIDIDYEVDSDIKTNNAQEHEILVVFHRWLKYKKDRKENYKSTDSLNTAFEKLKRFCKGDPNIAFSIINDAIGNNYAGFFEPKPTISPPSEVQAKSTSSINSHLNFMQKRHGSQTTDN
jgi:hypothetical protein